MKYILPVITAAALVCACSRQVAEDYPPCPVVPLYDIMYEYAALGPAEQADVLASDSSLIAGFLKVVSHEPFDASLVEWWANSMPVSVFTPDVDSVFPTLAPVEEQLGHILGRAAADSLGLPQRSYVAVVYGRPEAMLFVGSTLMIALNHYLGEDYPGYSHWPVYMRRQKSPERLPYDLAEALVATQYPYEASADKATVLSRMLYEGALVYARTQLVRNPSETLALGYDASEMRWLTENEAAMWQALVQRQLLYDTSPTMADRLVAPAPHVRDFGMEAPGRAGRYIGYRIVCAYVASHPDTPLRELLSPRFYTTAQTLIEANYKVK